MTYVAQYRCGKAWQIVMASNRNTKRDAQRVAELHFPNSKTRPEIRAVPFSAAFVKKEAA